jgi:ABC-type dipeptide/oligopeptide/nickel transport system permease subunit
MSPFWKRLLRTPAARRGLTMLLIVIGAALAAPLVAPTSPDLVDPGARLLAPLARSVADAQHPQGMLHLLGTDSIGRDP